MAGAAAGMTMPCASSSAVHRAVRWAALAVVAALATAALTGCGVDVGTKAGPGAVPVTLTLATPEDRGSPYTALVEDFAARVESETGGAVTVRIEWQMIPWSPDSEAELIRRVQRDDVDLALIPARAFDLAGIHELEGLQAPFLIDRPDTAIAAIELPATRAALERLGDADVVALSLALEGLRHPGSYGAPIVDLTDFDGLGIRTPSSHASTALMQALGAVPGLSSNPLVGADGATLGAAETGFAWNASLPHGLVVTSNVTFFPKYDVIAGSTERLARLDTGQREAVARAAADAAHAFSLVAADEEAAAADLCAHGGGIALASDDEVEAIRAAAAPALAALRDDPRTASLIDDLVTLVESSPAGQLDVPAICLPPTGDGAGWPVGG